MNYIYQVAYLNALKTKKLIPKNVLQDIELNKNFQTLISTLKEYKYNKIFYLNEVETDIYNAEIFEDIIYYEIKETINLIKSLLFKRELWLVSFLEYFYLSDKGKDLKSIIPFFNEYYFLFNKLNSQLLNNFLKLTIDFENIKIFLSYTLFQEKYNTQQPNFIPNGNISITKLKELFPSIEQLEKYLTITLYPQLKLSTKLQKENINFYYNYYLEKIIENSKLFYFTVEPIFFYFFEKLIETQKLKEIYYEIKYG